MALHWTELTELALEGVGWPAEALSTPYDRLPAKAEGVVPAPVWCAPPRLPRTQPASSALAGIARRYASLSHVVIASGSSAAT
eukprot:SAG31_NODE_11175_length_1058_cov_1.346194_1_plen_83_part_00